MKPAAAALLQVQACTAFWCLKQSLHGRDAFSDFKLPEHIVHGVWNQPGPHQMTRSPKQNRHAYCIDTCTQDRMFVQVVQIP